MGLLRGGGTVGGKRGDFGGDKRDRQWNKQSKKIILQPEHRDMKRQRVQRDLFQVQIPASLWSFVEPA